MEISLKNTRSYRDLSTISECNVQCIHVKIKNLSNIVAYIEKELSNTSWINSLDALSQLTYEATANRTITHIVNQIIRKVSNSVNQDIGEYIVSYSAQIALENQFNHIKLPIAELLKEKVSGNPGFDFHTINKSDQLLFGEAKFSMSNTPRAIALDQIQFFISLKKDFAEMNSLRPLLAEEVINNFIKNEKGYIGAFSLNGDIDTIMKNALNSAIILDLIKYKELHLIAVEIE